MGNGCELKSSPDNECHRRAGAGHDRSKSRPAKTIDRKATP